jgi:peptidoglycan/xylan/chitin deacetylase (PgdA/CDA1 family)
MKNYFFIAAAIVIASFACTNSPKIESVGVDKDTVAAAPTSNPQPSTSRKLASAAEIMARTQVPILCYHRIRPFKPSDSKRAKDYIVTPEDFRAQMKLLADSGYKTILPDQLMNYLQYGDPIPEKAVMLTFDDNVGDQMTVAEPILKELGFKGVFFIMTVTLNKPGYMSKEQVKQLHDEGHVIGSHTYDHQNMRKLPDSLWTVQVDKPQKQLKDITGADVKYFAYPFGLWKPENIPALQKRDLKAAFQLTEKRDTTAPLYTIRRMIVPGGWSANQMLKSMKGSFSHR